MAFTGMCGGLGASGPDFSSSAAARRSRLMVAAWVAGAAVLVAVAAGFLVGRQTAPAAPRELIQLRIEPPDSVVGFGRCCGNALALSPDGKTLVFAGSAGGDVARADAAFPFALQGRLPHRASYGAVSTLGGMRLPLRPAIFPVYASPMPFRHPSARPLVGASGCSLVTRWLPRSLMT